MMVAARGNTAEATAARAEDVERKEERVVIHAHSGCLQIVNTHTTKMNNECPPVGS